MQFNIQNLTGDNILLFTSNNYFDKDSLINFVPNLIPLLNDINNDNWIESVSKDKVQQLISALKTNLAPMLEFVGVLLNNASKIMQNLWQLPNYLYSIGITTAPLQSYDLRGKISAAVADGVTLNINAYDIKNRFANLAANMKLVLSSTNISERIATFTDNLAKVLADEFNTDDTVEEPADVTIDAGTDDNTVKYITNNTAINYAYNNGFFEGSNSVPLTSIIILFVIIIVIIVAVCLIALWLFSVFKKNNFSTNVNVNNIKPEKEHPEIII